LLTRWTCGELLLSPPTVAVLQAIGNNDLSSALPHLESLCRAHGENVIPPIYFSPDVQLIPLHTQALPPTSYTNAYLIGRNPCYLLDPGAIDLEEQARLFAVLDPHLNAGYSLAAVVLTHQHPDHIGAATVCAERYRVPILAHPITAERLLGKVSVQGKLHDGDRLDLGTAPDGSGHWRLEAVHTPGHAAGHLAFFEPHYRLLFAGDMVSTVSSVVIAPPEGDLAAYLQSLERLKSLDSRLLLPAHGSPSARPRQTLDDCITHRHRRERQLLAALGRGSQSVSELAQQLYKGLAANMMRFAELQVRAGLIKLEREGRVEQTAQGSAEMWRARARVDP
jgi:glyoxylase-like metal-dependent hydrolase (beta-lactamase superfamily II)